MSDFDDKPSDTETPATETQSVDDQLVSAMDEALAEDAAPITDTAAPQDVEQTAASQDGDSAAEQAEQAEDAEAEITALKLGERAATRFREMSGEIRDLKSALETAGVKDMGELPKVIERAKVADDLVNMVMETGASAEQYSQTLDYLRMVNAANRGDREAAEQAFALIEGEYRALAKALGRRVEGVDPLDEHQDLRDKIDAGELDEAVALEVVRARMQQAALQQGQQAQQQQALVEQGRHALAAWDQQMLAADPTYAAKREALSAQVAVIRAQLPPERWLAATQQLYAALPAFQPIPTPAPAPAKPTPGPMRPGRVTTRVLPAQMSAEAAIDAALDEF